MNWHQKVRRQAGKGVAAISMVVLIAMFAVSFLFLFAGRVHGSGTGCLGLPGCPPPNQCPVLFVAARGSGEPFAGVRNLTWQVSPALYSVYREMNMVLPGGVAQPKVWVLDYPALPVESLASGLGGAMIAGGTPGALVQLGDNVNRYLGGEHQGVAALWDVFNTMRLNCPTTRFVLAGYSQGAMVVHDFLNQLAATNDGAAQSAIIGAVLIADPDRVKHAGVAEFSTAPYSSYGVCDVVSTAHVANCPAAGPLQDIAAVFQPLTVSVCSYNDIVCDTSDLFANAVTDWRGVVVLNVNLGITTHKSYGDLPATNLAGELMGRFVSASV